MANDKASKNTRRRSITELLRLPQGPVSMAELNPGATPGYPDKQKDEAPERTRALAPELSDLQERLFAQGKSNPETAPNLLLVLQGMDTCGKGGVIRHVVGLVDPQGVQIKAFKAPTPEELSHDFLWRIRNALPAPGMIGVFDRSHYEDVLVVRVEHLVPDDVVEARYDQINAFERELAEAGTVVIKCFLNISKQEQHRRLAARLKDPAKHWKYRPGDLDTRAKWPAHEEAFRIALERCNTDDAPWFVVPSDNEWYRNWAVARLLEEHLSALDLRWPQATFDVAAEEIRLATLR